MDALGKLGGSHLPTHRVVAEIRDLGKVVEQSERLQNSAVNAHADAMIPALHAPKRRARGEGSLSQNIHRYPPTAPSIVYVGAQFLQSPAGGSGRHVWRGHNVPFVLHYLV